MWRRIGKHTLHDGRQGWIHKISTPDYVHYCAYIDAKGLGCWLTLDRAKEAIEKGYQLIDKR